MTTRALYERAWFADLAYVDWRPQAIGTDPFAQQAALEDAHAARRAPELTLPPVFGDEVGARLGPALASRIFAPDGTGWSVVYYQPNLASGFSATLFEQVGSGAQVLAVRGTESSPDQLTPDLLQTGLQEIGGVGLALSQTVGLVNLVHRLTAPPGVSVPMYELGRGFDAPADALTRFTAGDDVYWLTAGTATTGLGLIGPDARLDVTGHSLGGHLAALALRLFPERFAQAVTFNAPGFDPLLGLADTEALVTGLATTVGSAGLSAALQVAIAIAQGGAQASEAAVTDLFAPLLVRPPAPGFPDLAGAGRLISLTSEDQAPGATMSPPSRTSG